MDNQELKLIANSIRKDIINMVYNCQSGHPGGALGMTDIFTVLYNEYLNHNSKKPNDLKRDFVFLSNGHICAVLYATLAQQNYFPKKELLTFRNINSKLQGHPHFEMSSLGEVISIPGVTNSGGPLGQGISQAVGLAVSLKREKKLNKIYCFLGDGELQEGQAWEALMYAGSNNLNNIIFIIDRNNIQIDGPTNSVLNLEPLTKKFSAFNIKTIEFNGNDINQIKHVFKETKFQEKPIALIANTVPGKGVSFMENNYKWHGKAPNEEEYKQAIVDLSVIESKINEGEL